MKKITCLLLIGGVIAFCVVGCKKNNGDLPAPNSPCDSVNVTYNGTIVPILMNNCYNCHAGPAVFSYRLDTYDGVRAVAASGQLSGSVQRISPYTPMPFNTDKLSDCDIAKIKKWVDDGFPNN